ncbi:OmpA family protein [Telmatospirillum sp. J64-1]|uniref:OmpA family protein n=1 Tax=Telmatospirillum sp. J64-1 TaxID=2502183 RepID=UPI00115D6967|nr:OmpA family protein [Telmatospirillum sp. J64-1]
MRFVKTLLVLSLPLAAAACATPTERLAQMQPTGTPFQQALATDYRGLTQFEENEYDWRDANHFARKAEAAAQGQNVLPDEPSQRTLSYNWVSGIGQTEQSIQEVSQAHQRLIQALDGNARDRSPQVAARAQTQFDCWLEQLEEGHQLDHIAACRQGFEEAMQQLVEQPAPAPAPQPRVAAPPATDWVVYFEFDEAVLTDAARQIINQAAQAIRQHPGTPAVSVVGHTDRAGSAQYNMGLSQRRANAVRDALVQAGIPANSISVVGRGESEPLVETPDGVRQPQNRRAAIRVEVQQQ